MTKRIGVRTFLLLAVLVLALAGCGGDDANDTAATQPETVTVTETEAETETTETETEAEAEDECSTSTLRLVLHEQELPEAVAEVRRRIFEAAMACDYDTLEEIALEQGEGFTFSYGGGDSAADFWRDVEEGEVPDPGPKPMRALAAILTMPFTRNESGSYAWPPAYSESPTEDDWRALVYAGLYGADEVEQMKTQGTGYLGYRTAITPDGDWQFFVAGD